MKPTARSLKKLRKDGYLVAVVEKWLPIPGKRIKIDLFGFIDVLAIDTSNGVVVAVQATSRTNVAARIKKIREHENFETVRRAGWDLRVHGWGKMASGRWELREEMLS